jgi:D-alanyl-D-alanine carboxypeptidase
MIKIKKISNMSKNFRIFIAVFLISFASLWLINSFKEDLGGLVNKENVYSSEMYLAQMNMIDSKRKEDKSIQVSVPRQKEIDVKAEAALSLLVTPEGEEVLYGKNISEKRPIASITKLMTALTAFELNYHLDQPLEISQRAINQDGDKGSLNPGEKILFSDLLHSMLIESSNDAAFAISEGIFIGRGDPITKESFVIMMNQEAESLRLNNTNFVNPTGLNGMENYSTCNDLAVLSKYIAEKYPEIFEVTKKDSYEVFDANGNFHHSITESTNELLDDFPEIIGGKTGYTEEAGGCILLVMDNPKGEGYIINIVLGARSPESRFSEMRRLIYYYEGLL